MNQTELIDHIKSIAGVLRRDTFVKAATLAIERRFATIIETGGFRGIDGDGRSTEVLAAIARFNGGTFWSVDNNPVHQERAKKRVPPDATVQYCAGDSVTFLSSSFPDGIGFLYLDSYDYDANKPLPSQIHQVAELGAAFGDLRADAIVLLDDCNIPGGGKALLSDLFLKERGFSLVADHYQKLFVRNP